jgi:hypothetical protein
VLSLAPGAAFARLSVVVSLDRFINITRLPKSCQAFFKSLLESSLGIGLRGVLRMWMEGCSKVYLKFDRRCGERLVVILLK